MDFYDDDHIDVCQNIEALLKLQYELHPQLTDSLCIVALDNTKIAIKQQFGFAQNESVSGLAEIQGIITVCVELGIERVGKVNALTLKEYVARLEKIKRSVARHMTYGNRAYYEFIKKYV